MTLTRVRRPPPRLAEPAAAPEAARELDMREPRLTARMPRLAQAQQLTDQSTLLAGESALLAGDPAEQLDEESQDELGFPLYLSAQLDAQYAALGAQLADRAAAGETPETEVPASAGDQEQASAESDAGEKQADESSDADAEASAEPAETPDAEAQAAAAPEDAASEEAAAQPAAPAESAPEEPGQDSAQQMLAQWQGGVRSAGAAIPAPTIGAATSAPASIASAGRSAGGAHASRRQAIAQQAGTVLPPTPAVEHPPAPPASNPIPEYTQQIEEASSGLESHKLPDRALSPLATREGGTPPRLGTVPVNPRIFQLLITPGRLEAAGIPDDANNPDRRLLNAAMEEFHRAVAPVPPEGASAPVPIQDQGAPPIVPLPPQQGAQVGRVVARLLAEPGPAAERVMHTLKQNAYPHAVLLNESLFSSIGQAQLPTLQREMGEELQRIAFAAGVSNEQLHTMVLEQQQALEEERVQASLDTSSAVSEANSCVSEEGGQTLNTITTARQQLDQEAIQRQEAASGGTDPSVIEARRQQIADWVRERVTTETTNFQRQGDAREQTLEQAFQQQEHAYNYVAQRDEFRLLNEPTPISQRPPEEQSRLQDQALEIRNFARDHIQAARIEANGFKYADGETIRGWRSAVETAGTEAIHAARAWADRRTEEGRSWWERIVHRVSSWGERAREETIHWEARTTQQTRDLIANDLGYVAQLEQQVRAGATRESLLANEHLSAEQRAIVEAYFAPNANRNPLALIATRLESQIAGQRRAQARSDFEQELLAPGTSWNALNEVGAAERPGFDAGAVASGVHDAVAGLGTNEAQIYRNLTGLTPIQVAAVRRNYQARYHETLDAALEGDLSDDELARAQMQLSGDQQAADAYALHYAVDQWGTDEDTIMSVLRNQTPEDRQRTIAYYNAHFSPPLDAALKDDMSGHERDRALALMDGNIAEADAIAIDEAMRGGFWWGAGTDEAQIEGTYRQIRDEVLAQAQREGWNSAQMEAEVRRRNREVEAAFGRRYADVEEYRVPGHEGESVLRQAFRTELSGPELDLANAMQDNDLARADAARIEIERQGFYADDDTINGVLRSQYERSLEAVRLDEGPERREQTRRALERWTREHPGATADELSREQMRLEREMDRAMERSAETRSHVAMGNLEQAYSDQYNGRPLRFTLEMNMSGDELERARLLVAQGGHLTPYQELDFATRGVGTDEERLRESLRGRTHDEIQQIRAEWERNHPGENFDSFLRGELSGRDEFEIMDTVAHGAPESASERAAELRRHAEYELNHGAWLGGAVATDEADYLRDQMAALDARAARLSETGLSDEERDRVLFEFQTQAALADDSIQDHQRAIERITDTATQVVGMAAAIIVGTLATVLSGGTLGPVAVALIASAASTLSTMATKFLLKGADYGIEDFGTDLAVGVVDAVASAATAGVGSAIVGRFMHGAGGAAAHAAEGAALRVASSGGNRATQALERLGARIARSTGLSRLNQIPIVSRFTQAQEGALARLVRGGVAHTAEAAAERAAREAAMSTTQRVLSEIMAESLDNLIQAAPSAFAASVINDDNWHGNVLMNILSSTGQQVGQGVAMGSAMMGARMAGSGALHLGRMGVGFAGERLRMRTPEGRLSEGSRQLGAAYREHTAEHPAASYQDFLSSDSGSRLRAELSERGMLPTRLDMEAGLPSSRIGDAAAPGPRMAQAEPAPHPAETHTRTAEPSRTPTEVEAQARAAADGEARLARTPEPAPARAAEGAPAEAPASHSGDPEAAALREALPERMRESVDVAIRPDLPEGEVRVVPVREGGRVVGVRIEAGPGATPTDVMLHAHVVQGYQRFMGLLGRARELIARFDAWFHMREHAGVGTAAFEARLELEKLPALIEERMARLERGGFDPAAQARLLDEVNSLHRQIEHHQTRLNDFSEGRGYVAAEGMVETAQRRKNPDVAAAHERYAPHDITQVRQDVAGLSEAHGAARERQISASNDLVRAESELSSARRLHERTGLSEHEQLLREAEAAVEHHRQQVEQANQEFARAATELTGALEAQQGRLVQEVDSLEQQIREHEHARDQELRAVEDGGPSEAERALRQRIDDLDEQIDSAVPTDARDTATIAARRKLQLEMNRQQAELDRLSGSRATDRRARQAEIRQRAHEQIEALQSQARALRREFADAQLRALETARGRDWQGQGFNHLGKVEPCFPAGTLVKTPQGDRPIDALAEGDLVYSYDFATRRLSSRPIRSLWRNWAEGLIRLQVGGQAIFATGGHPFWDEFAGAWRPARVLSAGSPLRALDQAIIMVERAEVQPGPVATFNLEIEGAHTFYVGEAGILVHNADDTSASKFMRTERRPTTIYVIYDTSTTPKTPIYVGKTYQDLDASTRLGQHLRDALKDAEIGRKDEWLAKAGRGELEMVPERSGAWTEFETAVMEQHVMMMHGGPDVAGNSEHTTLQNRRNEITPETYRTYKNMDLRDAQGNLFRHNPCPL